MSDKPEIPENHELTIKQSLFVVEYLKDFNGSQAAIRAGYSKKTARFQACELLTKPNIKAAINEKVQEIIGDAETDIIENIQYWKSIRNDKKLKAADRNKASELLGRYRAMFTDKIDANLKGNFTVNMGDEDSPV